MTEVPVLNQVEDQSDTVYIDFTLLLSSMILLAVGLIMVASSSMDFANSQLDAPFYHIKRHIIYLVIGFVAAVIGFKFPILLIEKLSGLFLIISLIALILVLVPGIGREVNGSRRWINLGFIGLQPSEFAKISMILYIAGYLVRRMSEVRSQWSGFIKPMIILSILVVLLLLEPDFGSFVVILAAVIGMMFLAGVKPGQFLALIFAALCAVGTIAIAQPYRLKRFASFIEPFSEENRWNGGYQLTQALIAFGRGEWWGVGLGNSIQKLFYLPEAHTDFVISIFAEEFGFIGLMLLLSVYTVFVLRILWIGRFAELKNQFFHAYCCYGLGILFSAQILINIGVNVGLLPTKGLTLPFLSFGGTSLIVCMAVVGFMLNLYNHVMNAPIKDVVETKVVSKKKLRQISYE